MRLYGKALLMQANSIAKMMIYLDKWLINQTFTDL
jgi:hypothetical protein